MAYFIAKGLDEVSIILQGLPEMMKTLKPSPLFGAGVGKANRPVLPAAKEQPVRCSHNIAMVTALAVPFAPFPGFIAYALMGVIDFNTIVVASLAALAAGMIGTKVMHRLNQHVVKKLLSITLLISGGRILWSLIA